MSFDLLDRQPTDPPDVDSLEPSLSRLQELIYNHELLVRPQYVAVVHVFGTPGAHSI